MEHYESKYQKEKIKKNIRKITRWRSSLSSDETAFLGDFFAMFWKKSVDCKFFWEIDTKQLTDTYNMTIEHEHIFRFISRKDKGYSIQNF